MRIANGEWRGADITITGPDDSLQVPKSIFFCSFQFAYPKVFFSHCRINNPLTALSVTAMEDWGTNSENKSLHIVDPRDPQPWARDFMAEKGVDEGDIDAGEWAIFHNLTIDFSHLPVFIFGRGCSIEYSAPSLSRNMFTYDEWLRLEAIYAERGWTINDDGHLAEVRQSMPKVYGPPAKPRLVAGRR
jgi:hypothetical protein